ncbi:trypsin-like peptidase domain-containing protein [Rhizobium leguminosarum]|uniref:nSTAND1 domain-containing NTPase n=1 Tax=Rhizobium leguminosarum TaxID=384 RepID=UPI003F9D05D0
MTLHYTQPVACIRDEGGAIHGTGWLALGRYVVTCAHVVDDALKRKRGSVDRPDVAIKVDLPFLRKLELSARVVAWFPARPLSDLVRDPLADIAVLEIQGDGRTVGGIEPAAVDRRIPARGTGFLTYGFPAGFDNGVEASGEVLVQDPGGWLHVKDTQAFGHFIKPGFSGAPVVSHVDLRFMGMATAADRNEATRLAFLLPSHLICRAFPPLAKPYRELFAFGEEDADLFFGRTDFVTQLQAKLGRHSFAAVIGPSGSGKTSVVLAGLVPSLRQAGWNIAVCRPLRDPLLQLGFGLASLTKPDAGNFSARIREAEEWATRLREDPGRILDLARQLGRSESGQQARTLVIIDQFEELFTQDMEVSDGIVTRASTSEHGSPHQAEFLAVLEAIASLDPDSSPIQAVVTMRVDFMGHALAIRRLATLLQDTDIKLGPMTAAELSEAIRRPARTFGVEFEDGLAEELVAVMQGRTGGLPLLAFTLDRLWRRQEERMLTWAAYRGPDGKGGLETALNEHADEVLHRLGQAAEAGVRRVMLRLVRLGDDDAPDARAVARRGEIGEADWSLAQRLADGRSRLLTLGRDAVTGEETAELVHEALIGAWSRLRGWLLEDRDYGLWRQRLNENLQTWTDSSQDADLLLRGRLLHEAATWLATPGSELNDSERAFINASQDHAREEAEEELRNAHERERTAKELAEAAQDREQLANKLKKAAEEGERAATELAEIRGLALDRAAAEAQRQRLIIQLFSLAGAGIALLAPYLMARVDEGRTRSVMLDAARTRISDGRPLEAASFAVAAAAISPKASEAETLVEDTGVLFPLLAHFPDGVADKHRLSPDGTRLLLQARDLKGSMWDLKAGKPIREFGPIVGWLVYFSEQRVITRSLSDEVSIWNLVDGALIRALGERGRAKLLYDTGADDVFVTVSDEHCTLWRVSSGTEISVLGDPTECDAVTLNDKYVITRSHARIGAVWDHQGKKVFVFPKGCQFCGIARNDKYAYALNDGNLETYRLPAFVEGPKMNGNKIVAVEYSPDGTRLATINSSGQASLWELGDGEASVMADKITAATWVEFSPNGELLIAKHKDGSGLISDGRQGLPIKSFGPGEILDYRFVKNTGILAILSSDGAVDLWDTLQTRPFSRLPDAGQVPAMMFSPDHTRIAISSGTKHGYLWDLKNQRKLTDFDRLGSDSGREGKFSGDGQRYVSHSWDLGSSIWDTVSGDRLGRVGGPATVAEVEISKDGTRILAVNPNSGAAVWDASNIKVGEISDVNAQVCEANRGILRFDVAQRGGFDALMGRPWNPCDWARLDSVEGWLQATRRLGIRFGLASDYKCDETSAFSKDKVNRGTTCTENK